jgi:hypothetical protein
MTAEDVAGGCVNLGPHSGIRDRSTKTALFLPTFPNSFKPSGMAVNAESIS